jgi:hypothetical protein
MTAAAGRGVGDPGHRKPDGRALSRWRGQLDSLQPRQLWVGTLELSHLDAAVRVSRAGPLDPFHRHLLAATLTMPAATPAALDACLGMGPPAGLWLDELRAADLVRFEGDRITVTPLGERALAAGTYPHPTTERRRFTFLVPGPHYLPWLAPPGPHDPSVEVAAIDWIAECVTRPAEWKRRTGFPEDVEAVELPAADLAPAAAWRRISVARSERVPVVVAVTAAGALDAFVPYAAGGLHAGAPALRMADSWREPFREIAAAEGSSAGEDVGDGWRLIGGGRLRRAVDME